MGDRERRGGFACMTGFWGIIPVGYSLLEDPVALLFFCPFPAIFPWGSLQQHVGSTAKIKTL